MGIIRDSFVIFKNWSDAINALPEEYQLEAYKSLVHYGTTGVMPADISPVTKAILISFSVGMENSICRYNASVENGKKGGRPKKEKQETQQNLEKPSETQENQDEPTRNLNVNVNVNDNVNYIKLVKKNTNVFDSYNNACACERVPIRTDKERQPFITYYKEFFNWCFVDKFKDNALEIVDTILEARDQTHTERGLVFNQKKYTFDSFIKLISQIDTDKFRSIVVQIVSNKEIQNRPLYILGCVINAATSKCCKMTQEEMEKFIQEMER